MTLASLRKYRSIVTSLLIVCLISLPFLIKAQPSKSEISDFRKYIQKKFKLADSLKSKCGWMYAIVKVEANSHNAIIKYDVVNHAPQGIKDNLKFLLGFKLSKEPKPIKQPVLFYLAIDNIGNCKNKRDEKIFYDPNDAASTIWMQISEVIRKNPKAILMPEVLIFSYPKPQY